MKLEELKEWYNELYLEQKYIDTLLERFKKMDNKQSDSIKELV